MRGRLNNGLPSMQTPNPWYPWIDLHSKREFADVITLRILRCGDYSGLSRWSQCHTRVFLSVREKQNEIPTGMAAWEGLSQYPVAGFKDGWKGPWAKECSRNEEKQRNRLSPKTSRRNTAWGHLGFSPLKLMWPQELWDNNFVLLWVTKFMVICYSSKWKLLQCISALQSPH